jgi:hypothetical protein
MSALISLAAGAAWLWIQVLGGAAGGLRPALLPLGVIAFYLAQANIVLVLFNLLPGFPLDGGRILRAFLWWLFNDVRRATFWAMVGGRLIAGLLAVGGLYIIIRGELSGGWLVVMGWFLWRAAGEAYHAVLARRLLHGVTVAQLMKAPLERVSAWLNLKQVHESDWLLRRLPLLAVDLQGEAVGLVGVDQLRHVNRGRWEDTRVYETMKPLTAESSIGPDRLALEALQMLVRRQTNELAVVEEGQVVGSISRVELARYLEKHGE